MPNVAATIIVGNNPTRVNASASYVYALNSGDGTLSRIDPSTNNVIATVSLGGTFYDFAVGSGNFFAVDSFGNFKRFNPSGGLLTTVAGSYFGPVFYDGTYVWAAQLTGNAITRFTNLAVGTSLSLGSPPAGTTFVVQSFAFDGANVWAFVRNDGGTAHKIVKINPAGPTITATFSTTVGSTGFCGLAFDTTNTFLWLDGGNTIKKINPATGAVVATISATSSSNVVFESTSPGIWKDEQSTSVYRLDPVTGGITATIVGLANLTRMWVFAFGDVWASSSFTGAKSVYRITGLGPPAAAPTVTSITPNNGPTSGGTPVSIVGTNFQSGAAVAIGGISCTGVSFISATNLTATTPPNLVVGVYDVMVTNPDGNTGIKAAAYTYAYGTPTIVGVSPSSGLTVGGNVVTVIGTNFSSLSTVTFGGVSATGVVITTSSSLTCIAPPSAAGAVTVAVTNPGPLTGSLAAAYTYLTLPPPPPVSSRWNAGNTILGLVHTRDSTYIVLSNRDPAVTQTFLYDMDRKLWFENTMGIVAMTEELYSGSLTFFYGTSDGVVHQGFTATPPNYGNTPRVQTIFMNPPGKSREDWAVLQGVHVYGTDAGLVVTAATDDASPVTLVPVVDPTNTLPQGVDDIFYAPQGAVPRGRLFRFTLSWPGSSPEAMAAFEALWSFATDQQGAGGVP